MEEYASLINFVNRVKILFGERLGIENFEIRILDDVSFKSPDANSLCIRIPKLYLEHLKQMCDLILSSNLVFRGIGDLSKEVLSSKSYQIDGKMLTFSQFLKNNGISEDELYFVPNDEMRKSFSSIISTMMIMFLFFHELGHVRQLNFQNLQQTISESDSPESGSLLECQASEIDADVFAADFVGFYIHSTIQNDVDLIGLTKFQFLHANLFSILLFFYFSDLDGNIHSEKRHPHPLVRISEISKYIEGTWIDNKFVDSREQFRSLVNSVLTDMDEVIREVFTSGEVKENTYFEKFKNKEIKFEVDKLEHAIDSYPYLNFNRPYKLQY